MFLHYIEKYYVNEFGIIKNSKTGKEYSGKIDNRGYLRVDISINGKRKVVFPHRIVAETFIPNPDNLPEVNHKDGDKTNDYVENLEWVTAKENTTHAVKTGLINSFTQGGKPCVQKDLKGNMINIFNSMSEASRQLNIAQSLINRVCLGQRKSTKGFIFEYLK